MKKIILTTTLLAGLLFNSSCNNKTTQTNTNSTQTENTTKTTDDIVTSASTNKDGEKLEMSFNNTKDIVVLNFKGETIELAGQKPASGIWYKNEQYELRGSGDDVELSKNGKLVFKSDVGSNNQENNTQTTNQKTWWIDKQFVNNRPTSKNPEEGGADFLKINKNKTADFKVGDIVESMTWSEENGTLSLKNKITERTVKFKVTSTTLVDEYGTIWTIKK